MKLPTLTWVGYNVIRVAAMVFFTWGLVVQFFAVADDMKEYSLAKKTDPEPSSTESATPLILNPTSTSQTSSATATDDNDTQENAAIEATNAAGSSTSAVAPTATDTAPQVTTVAQLPSDSADTSTLAFAGTPAKVPLLRRRDRMALVKRDAGGDGVGDSDGNGDGGDGGGGDGGDGGDSSEGYYYGSSAVPRQAGGPMFVVLSRLLFALAIGVLSLGQLGWPETWLYEHMSWFGATSTPVWLGIGQLVIGIGNLAVHAKPAVLVPAWCIAVVGLINFLGSVVLLFLGRRMPKHPPPAMYFHLATRFLYWTEPPPFYRRLREGPDGEKVDGAHMADKLEKGRHRSNALEIGLEEDDDDDEDESEKAIEEGIIADTKAGRITRTQKQLAPPVGAQAAVPRMQVRHDPLPEQDVRNGGYPTFSGRGVTDPTTQVPKGVLDVDHLGRVRGFVREDARRAENERLAVPRHLQQTRTGAERRLDVERDMRPELERRPEMEKGPDGESRSLQVRARADSTSDQDRNSASRRAGEASTPRTWVVKPESGQKVKLARPPSRADRASRVVSTAVLAPTAPSAPTPSETTIPSQPLVPSLAAQLQPQEQPQRHSQVQQRQHAYQPQQAPTGVQANGPGPRPRPKQTKIPNPLTPINEEQPSSLPYMSPSTQPPASAESVGHKSVVVAASELAPQFPLPPTRTPGTATKAKRESIATATDIITGPPPQAQAQAQLQPEPEPQPQPQPQPQQYPHPPSLSATVLSKALDQARVSRVAPTISNSQLRLPPKRDRGRDRPPTFAAPPPPTYTPGSTAPSTPSKTSHFVASRLPPPALPLPRRRSYSMDAVSDAGNSRLRSSMAQMGRNTSMRSASSHRTARGVRFDLELPSPSPSPSPQSDSEVESKFDMPVMSPRSAIRIPGTNISIPIPFSAPATPRRIKRQSAASFSANESDSDIVQGGSMRVESPPYLHARDSSGELDPDRRGSVVSRPKSMSVLGGGFLVDSGDELDDVRHRRRASSSTTLDRSSFSS